MKNSINYNTFFKNNKMLLLSIMFFIFSILFFINSYKDNKANINDIIDFFNIDFAGEKVEFEWKYFLNKEKFEKELNILKFNTYQFVLYHKRESLFFPYIEKKLKEAWIPDDFKYLAVAESALKNDILSNVGAWWIWQFIESTGIRYGLVINNYIDQRYDFEKSTDAAILFLKKLHNNFKNWTLVAAAYNRWENWIKNALKDQNVNSYYDLYLNEETSRYIFRILAIKYIMINKYKIFYKEDLWEQFKEPEIKNIILSDVTDLKKWCLENNINYSIIKKLNPWIIWNTIPAWNWTVKILKNN